MFIHPIAPVLKETRPVVVQFMEALGSKVCKTIGGETDRRSIQGLFFKSCAHLQIAKASKLPSARGRLHFLDFFHSLLTCPPPDGVLRPELELDGTHLSPRYVEILGSSLGRV